MSMQVKRRTHDERELHSFVIIRRHGRSSCTLQHRRLFVMALKESWEGSHRSGTDAASFRIDRNRMGFCFLLMVCCGSCALLERMCFEMFLTPELLKRPEVP
jgi:hypothetical protein